MADIADTIDSRDVEKKEGEKKKEKEKGEEDSDKIIGRLVTANDSYQSALDVGLRSSLDTFALLPRINRHLHV